MIDTIKFLIPVESTLDLISLRDQFIEIKKENLKSNEIEFQFYIHEMNVGSFSRFINVKMSEFPLGFFVEFSIPKYEYGNNVEMVRPHSVYYIIQKFYDELKKLIDYNFVHFTKWEIYRLDICYNWLFDTEDRAKRAMSFIQRIDFPKKQKYIYESSVMFRGSAYTIKFYLKGSEFYKNDFKEMSEVRAVSIYEYAKRILRYEISIRRQYLQDMLGLKKVTILNIIDDKNIEFYLKYYLEDRILKYIYLGVSKDLDVQELLFKNFTKRKATSLYLFYKNYYFNTEIKDMFLNGGMSRMTIYSYKKELKKLGIGFEVECDDSGIINVLEELVIPSKNSKFKIDFNI